MAIAANKVPGVRAAACTDSDAARLSREHNDANILTLGARVIGRETARAILEIWLETDFAGGRHARRVEKLKALERASVPAEAPHAAPR
jgi:ribose 5-phosphate isomerase B